MPSVTGPVDQSGGVQDAQVLGDGARGDPQAAGQLDGRQRLFEEAEQPRPGGAEQGGQRRRADDRHRRTPQRGHSPAGIDETRRLVRADRGRGLVREHGREEQQPPAGRRDPVSADHLVDVQLAVLPAQIRVHVREEQPGAAQGEPPGAVGHVGF